MKIKKNYPYLIILIKIHIIILGIIALCYSNTWTNKMKEGINSFNNAFNAWDELLFINTYQIFHEAENLNNFDSLINNNKYLIYYWKAVTRFHHLLYYLGMKNKDKYKKDIRVTLKEIISLLEQSISLNNKFAESYSLLATTLGIKIGVNPIIAPWVGPKILNYQSKAKKLDPDNPRTAYLAGSSYFNAPKMLGGFRKSLKYFLQAENFYEKEKVIEEYVLLPKWGYSSSLCFTARTYLKLNKLKKAIEYYKKALTENPLDKLAIKEYRELMKKPSLNKNKGKTDLKE